MVPAPQAAEPVVVAFCLGRYSAPMDLADLPTPSLVLDRAKVIANTAAMARRMNGHGVRLRPHAKTAKSAEVARLAAGEDGAALAVSTLAEADYFLGRGFTDLIYAVCVAPGKLDDVAALRGRGADLTIITDGPEAAHAINRHHGAHKVLIEIDCGEHRTGVPADSAEVVGLARTVTESGRSEIAGILTHAGHSYACRTPDAVAEVAEAERRAAVTAAENLRAGGFETPIISVGSTPTATHGKSFEGVTEVRPGVYVFQDLFQAGIGSCTQEALALSVLATVISRRPDRGALMLDAGGLALSKDRSTAELGDAGDRGYGGVATVAGEMIAGLRVGGVHQEHGAVAVSDGGAFDRIRVGSKLRVYPNHACMTAAAYPNYAVVDGGTEVVDTWERCNGW